MQFFTAMYKHDILVMIILINAKLTICDMHDKMKCNVKLSEIRNFTAKSKFLVALKYQQAYQQVAFYTNSCTSWLY